jgi:hypothetical protein
MGDRLLRNGLSSAILTDICVVCPYVSESFPKQRAAAYEGVFHEIGRLHPRDLQRIALRAI